VVLVDSIKKQEMNCIFFKFLISSDLLAVLKTKKLRYFVRYELLRTASKGSYQAYIRKRGKTNMVEQHHRLDGRKLKQDCLLI